MANVMQSLFNLNMPQQQQAAPAFNPLGTLSAMGAEAGASLRQNIAGAFGQQTPQQALSSIIQRTQQEVDLSTPEGLNKLADNLNQLPQFSGIALAMRQEAAKLAQQQQLTQAETFQRTALGMRALQERPTPERKLVSVDLGDRIEFRDPVTNELVETVKKGLTPEQQRKAGEAGAEEKPGFIGKTGAFRNQFGEVIPGSEMQKQRTGFQAAEDLLNNLNKITSTDIKNAEAKIDYTQGEARKAVAGTLFKKTLDAQTKIAASQLLQQIESLPPGSASDADMRASARSFPGYSDATALLNWVNRTKETLEQSLARQNEQYGFNRRIRSSAPLSFGQQQGRTRGSNQPPQGVTQQEWNAMTPEEKGLFQ